LAGDRDRAPTRSLGDREHPPLRITPYRRYIEERFKDAKLGQALRHLPSGKLVANRLRLCCCLLALNLSAFICDLSPAAAASGQAADPDNTPQRRHAKTLRRTLSACPAGSCAPPG
jgi:hypothetical protein